MFQVRKAEPTVVTTPLPSAQEHKGEKAAAPRHDDPYLRPANEDDDGYDPYSDRREEPPLFEASPWD
ncbi:MAG: hypothetical protein Q4D06_01055 [Coriobacteriia bacterium]|nr:hypothetical protein [Coriobacteriia bacterium]